MPIDNLHLLEDGDLFEYIYLEEYAPAQILQVCENTVSFMEKKKRKAIMNCSRQEKKHKKLC